MEDDYSEQMEFLEEQAQISAEEGAINNAELADLYNSPEPEKQYNQHTFIAQSLDLPNPEKVTYLTESELGNPFFSMRFLLDMEDISRHYIDSLADKYAEGENKIANYFRDKVENVSHSGMSNKGFIQSINVTRKMDLSRRKNSSNIDKMKGGNK